MTEAQNSQKYIQAKCDDLIFRVRTLFLIILSPDLTGGKTHGILI